MFQSVSKFYRLLKIVSKYPASRNITVTTMKKRKFSMPIVIDLASGSETTPRPKPVRTSSVIDLTNTEPDVIVVDSVVNTPQTRSRKRSAETLSRSSSVSENEVMVLSSNFRLKKKPKTEAVKTPKINPTQTVVSSKKKKRSAAKIKKVTQSQKKAIAKSKRRLADISNIPVNRSKRSNIKSPAPLSKAANDYYSKITKAINKNKNSPKKRKRNSRPNSPKKRGTITKTINNGATVTREKPIASNVTVTKVVQSPAKVTKVPPPPHQIVRNNPMQPSLHPSRQLPAQTQAFQTHRQLFLARSREQSVLNNNFIAVNGRGGCQGMRRDRPSMRRRLQREKFDNFYNPNPINVEEEGFRPIVIDGSNVACGHGRGRFSPKGLQICVDFFNKRGMERVKVFLPQSKQGQIPTEMLTDLRSKCEVVFTPVSNVNGVVKICYDDRFIVQYANEVGGIIVSTDNYRDLLIENPSWKHVIQTRLLMFTWVDDLIMFPNDPLGKNGPTLQEFLKF